MARIRMIKPEFFDDPDVAELSLAARLFFIGLWTQADKAGRVVENLRRLKARIFPYDELDVTPLVAELFGKDLIRRYKDTHGQPLIWIRTFTKHQRSHPKEPDSTFEPFSEERAVKKTGKPGKKPASRGKVDPSRGKVDPSNPESGDLDLLDSGSLESGDLDTLEHDAVASSSRVSPYPADFLQVWKLYRKGLKSQALVEFQAAKRKNPQVLALMLEALAWQTQQPKWTEDGGRYRLDTHRWIKGRGWEQEPFHSVDETDAAWDRVMSGKGRVL